MNKSFRIDIVKSITTLSQYTPDEYVSVDGVYVV